MKRLLAVLGVVGLIGAGVAVVQQLDRERQYRDLLARGEDALRAGNHYSAIEEFTAALAWRPGSMVAFLRRGAAYSALRRDDEAVRDLKEAARLAPDAPQPLVALGDLFGQRGDPAQAAAWYEQAAARLKDENPAVLYALALARYRSGAPAEAIAPLQRAVSRNDALAEAHYLLGLAYRDTQNPAAAIRSLEQALARQPSLIPAREELADIYRSLGRPVEEMRELQALATLDQQVGRVIAIALAEARGGQLDSALGTLAEASRRAPNDSRVQLALGRVYLARAERSRDPLFIGRALDVLESALGGTALRSEGLALYGRALYLAGQLQESERILREAVATTPVDAEAYAFLADASEALSHDLEARDALINLDVLEGNTGAAESRLQRVRRIGLLSLRGEDPRTALRFLDQAVTAEPAHVPTLALLARAQWRLGAADDARETLARGLALDPANGDLRLLSRTIR
jgi:tetratricopeptide (TPR) repeat protein